MLVQRKTALDQNTLIWAKMFANHRDKLTPKQKAVFDLLVKGKSNFGIARELCLETRSVERYVGIIYRHFERVCPADGSIHLRTWLALVDKEASFVLGE
jgi:DNA-binding NarL/FixJ family response regulator